MADLQKEEGNAVRSTLDQLGHRDRLLAARTRPANSGRGPEQATLDAPLDPQLSDITRDTDVHRHGPATTCRHWPGLPIRLHSAGPMRPLPTGIRAVQTSPHAGEPLPAHPTTPVGSDCRSGRGRNAYRYAAGCKVSS